MICLMRLTFYQQDRLITNSEMRRYYGGDQATNHYISISDKYSIGQIEQWSLDSPIEEIVIDSDVINFTGFVGPNSGMVKAAKRIYIPRI